MQPRAIPSFSGFGLLEGVPLFFEGAVCSPIAGFADKKEREFPPGSASIGKNCAAH